MVLDSNDDDSDSKESDFLSIVGEDVDVYLNHYRIPRLVNHGLNDNKGVLPRGRSNREQVKYHMDEGRTIMSLAELAAQKVACHLPFGQVEHFNPPVPEPLQCRIAFWSFPQDEEDVRLYTCLANGNADVFIRAEELISLENCVCDMLQVGFHLSANVKFVQDSPDDSNCFKVAITFDRRRITSCSCSCSAVTFWCQHTVAVCLQRIRKPQELTLRAPVSESLQRLGKDQLQKFAQYLINEHPQQILPAAQKILDQLLSGDDAMINQNPAAPDPTAGATINEQTSWCLDDTHLSMDIQKILLKQCTAQPTVCSDIQALHNTSPPAATEYSQLLRPIRGREPEGLWNLISIVGEMMKRRDANFFLLLEIMTKEVLRCEKIVTWWFETKVSLHSGSTIYYANNNKQNSSNNSSSSQQCTSQYSCSNFCDEIVHLWRLAAMDPSANPDERKRLHKKFFDWQLEILRRHSTPSNEASGIVNMKLLNSKRNFLELFPGFKIAMEGCLIDWSDWDDKNSVIIELQQEKNTASNSVKSNKKKKKKSKAVKQTEPTSTSSTIDDQAQPSTSSTSNDLQGDNVGEKENEKPVEAEPRAVGNEVQANELQAPIVEQDLQVYFMEPRDPSDNSAKQNVKQPESLEDFIKVNPRKLNDPLEILYAKTEGLYAHGHLEEARKLAVRAATEILSLPNYPSSKNICIVLKRRKKKGSLDNQMSIAASEALTKISFLCNVLLDDSDNHNLVFRLALFGVELKRSPAATKPLEVKLINQKHDLITLLKSINLHEEELIILREKAQALRDGHCENNSNALTSIILSNYIFEALVLSKSSLACLNCNNQRVDNVARSGPPVVQYSQLEEHFAPPGEISQQSSAHVCGHQIRAQQPPCSLIVFGKTSSDSSLGFHAALNAISVRINLLEADHPLLCEGTRRQRGELALSLLTHYKDDQEKLDLILKHLLDKDVILSAQHVPTNSSSDVPPKKNFSSSQDPNQPTEASAHFMFELAKTVFDKAGGNSTTAHLFRPQLVTQNGGRGIHRRLHMCSLRIALYALGLQNRTSINWMQRTYNGRASFIHEQALEIGLSAIKFLSENWEGYLTPVEAASIADKAGCSSDVETKRVAAEMAKSCLKYANHLDFNAVRRILAQCRDQSIEMIEEACSEIEQVAENESVCADVLFTTARAWYNLYDRLVKAAAAESHNSSDSACCGIVLKDHAILPLGCEQQHHESVIDDWQHQTADKCQQFNNDLIHPKHWDCYGRVDFIPTMYTPTYKHIEYVKAAYRVGIKALDALKPSLHMGSKHNPQKEEDILWLLLLSKILGRECLHKFSWSAIKNITDPHILHIISTDLINFFVTLPGDHLDRVNILLPLIDKCLDRFVKRTRDLMKHVSYDQKSHIDSILDVAQMLTDAASTLTAVGHYKELLKIVDSRKTNKKFKIYIETFQRHSWVEKLLSQIKECSCSKCRAGREVSVKFLTT